MKLKQRPSDRKVLEDRRGMKTTLPPWEQQPLILAFPQNDAPPPRPVAPVPPKHDERLFDPAFHAWLNSKVAEQNQPPPVPPDSRRLDEIMAEIRKNNRPAPQRKGKR